MLTHDTRLQDFPSLETMTYLNTAAEGIPPRVVGEALAQYVRDKQLGMDGRVPHLRSGRPPGRWRPNCTDSRQTRSGFARAHRKHTTSPRWRYDCANTTRSSSTTSTSRPVRRRGCTRRVRRRSTSGGRERGR